MEVERFRGAWQAVLDAHDSLRASFLWEGLAQPLQVITRQLHLPMTLLDWRTEADIDAALAALASAENARGFDLSAAPLLRLTLVQRDANRYHLIFTCHHILLDGWSTSQLFGEVLQRYAGGTPPAAGRFGDYLAWLQGRDPALAETFWRSQLQPLTAPTRLAGSESAEQGHGVHHLYIEGPQAAELQGFARAQKVTLNTLVQAAWLLLLQRCTGQDAVALGVTVSGRPAQLVGVERQLGLFINSLPVIGQPLPQLSVGQWLQQVQGQNLALREFEYTPLADIQRWGRARR